MLLKLAAMDDWEPPRPWSADIILALKHYPAPAAVSASVCMCVCVPPVLFVLVQTSGWSCHLQLGGQEKRREGQKETERE